MNTAIDGQSPHVTRADRARQNGHGSFILWLTGLSCSGKSTLAYRVEEVLFKRGLRTYVLDGDNMRRGLCGDLGFSSADRSENIRRIGEVSRLFVDSGVVVIAAFISPFREDRRRVRQSMAQGDFIEVYCDASLRVCEGRDIKGLYERARSGSIPEFTGVSSPYEKPESPEIVASTGRKTIAHCVRQIVTYLEHEKKI